MSNESKYIPAALLLETSYGELLKQLDAYGPLLSWTRENKQIKAIDLLNQNCVFVVGEPGQGKSRLLQELMGMAQRDGYGTSIVRLNNLGRDQSLEEVLSLPEEGVKFDLTATDQMLVCLDALDEVSSVRFPEVVKQIRKYIMEHPNHTVVVTSRLHFFTKYEESLAPINATYALLMPLTKRGQIILLEQYDLSSLQIEEAFLKLRQQGRETILQTPRYLEYFAQWYSARTLKDGGFSRSDIFNHFVNQALGEEDKKVDKRIAALRRRTLEKLALVMEIAQIKAITHDDMITFIEDYRSEAKSLLFSTTEDMDAIYNHGLLKDDGENISFDNAELQEYLAASTINRMDDPTRAAFQLAINKEQRTIQPSWYSPLSFLLEMQPMMLGNVIDLVNPTPDNPDRPQDPEIHKLMSGVGSDLITVEVREGVFKRVLDYYLNNDIYIQYDIATRLAFYSTPATDAYLITCAGQLEVTNSYSRLVSVTQVVGELKRINRLSDEVFWLSRLRTWALLSGDGVFDVVLKRCALHSLEYFKDESLIADLKVVHSHRDNLVGRAYESMCNAINPNNLLSIAAFKDGIKHGSIEARMFVLNVTSNKGLKSLLAGIASDRGFLRELVTHDSIFKKEDNALLENISKQMDVDLLESCKEVVRKAFDIDSGYYMERSEFLGRLVDVIVSSDPKYFEELVNWCIEEEGSRIYAIESHLSRIMRQSDLEFLSGLIKSRGDIGRSLFRVIAMLDIPSSSSDSRKIVDVARSLHPDLFAERDAIISRTRLRGQRDRNQEDFDRAMQDVLERGHIPALKRVLEMFNEEADINRYGSDIDKYIWSRCKTAVLDTLDPATAALDINHGEGNSRSFAVSEYIWVYSEIATFALKTGRSIAGYRDKFVALLPFTFNEDTESCLDLLGSLSSEESTLLIKAYTDLSLGRARFQPSNFIDAVKRFHLIEAVDVLNSFVSEEGFDRHVRCSALELSQSLKPDKALLDDIVEKYDDDTEGHSLRRTADALLITKHNDSEAIGRLMLKIKGSASEHIDTMGVHSVGAVEHELHSGEIAKPLRELSDASYISKYIDLLDFSFELFKRGDRWHSYTYYLWNIVAEYFDRLKNDLSYAPLILLEKWMSEHSGLPGLNYFKDKVVELRRSYIIAIDKPKNINAAIKLAERVRSEDGIAVSSSGQLKIILEKIINEQLVPWIESEARKVLDETHAQKLIKIQLESLLLKNGFNPSQLQMCNIVREAQELDDTRTDFVIYHGFVGPVIIELKLFSNTDLKAKDLNSKKSFFSLQNYMRQYKTEQSILLVLDDEVAIEKSHLYVKRVKKITDAYMTIPGTSVISARLLDRVEKIKKPKA